MPHFALVDCNNFYVSCERLFNPRLEGLPVIVLSNNDGCVVARSQEAKKLNIAMGAPFFKIRDLCLQFNVVVFSSNYQVYGDISERVMRILADRCPDIQIYSIDEAFLTYPDAMAADAVLKECSEMRRIIKKWVGIPTSIGLATTKTLSKVANDMAKKDRTRGIFDLRPLSVQQEVLKDFPIEDVWGIGSRLSARLRGLGIFTAAEFRDMEPSFIRKKMGVVGERMVWELRGVSCLPLEQPKDKKSIGCSRSFGKAVSEPSDLAEALATHVHTACVKLRQQRSCAQALCVSLEAYLDMQAGTRRYFSTVIPFAMPTNDTAEIIGAAKKCLSHLFCKGLLYKKCGIILLDLLPENSVIPDLFLGTMDPKRQKLLHAVDHINRQLGKNTLFYGAMGVNPRWKMRSERRSRCYTTDWEELAVAKA